MDKKTLRIELSSIRAAISDREKKELLIFNKLKDLIAEKNFKKIFTYISMGNEVDTKRIISYYFNRVGYKIFVPFCLGGQMQALELIKSENLSVDKHGNLIEKSALKPSNTLPDVALVPMLGFDKHNHRIGYGGGYYDKFLANNSIYKVGLAFSEQQTELLIPEPHDIPLDVIIIPQYFIFRNKRFMTKVNLATARNSETIKR